MPASPVKLCTLPLALLLALALASCGDDGGSSNPTTATSNSGNPTTTIDLDETAQVARFSGLTVRGTGIHIGDGKVLTVWHLTVGSILEDIYRDNIIAPDDYLTHFNDPEPADATLLDDYYCFAYSNDGDLLSYRIASEASTDPLDFCAAIDYSRDHSYVFAGLDDAPRLGAERVLYANMNLNLAIIDLGDISDSPLQALPPVPLDPSPLVAGDEVHIITYPTTSEEPIIERCAVLASPNPYDDPATDVPTLSVPSAYIDCGTARTGSSGGPVLRADTGELVGLVWNSDPTGQAYVTPVSAWLDFLQNPERTSTDTRLQDLLGVTP